MNVVLTGSSSGIGRALAGRLLQRGHRVWGLARSDQSDFAAAHPDGFRWSRCDVADLNQVEGAAREVGAAWPHADALVCCAGTQGAIGRAMAADPREWSATVRANLEGTYHPIRAFHALLLRAPRRAKVVCFSGGGATKARPNFSAYGSAKTAIVRLVETIAAEEGTSRLDINAVAPGAIATRMTDEVIQAGPAVAGPAEYETALKLRGSGPEPSGEAPAGRPCEAPKANERRPEGTSPEGSGPDPLGLVEWLLSPESDGISGRLISAVWDPWPGLRAHRDALAAGDGYTLRRVVPEFLKTQ
jgi:NAD(P)-dependent dehydrogenase (short-subunit alcohol dehydrogenase family)